MAIAAHRAELSEMNIVLLVAVHANETEALKVGVRAMAVVATEAIMIALEFEEAEVMNAHTFIYCKGLVRVAAFAIFSKCPLMNIRMAIHTVGRSELLCGGKNLVVLEQMFCVTFLTAQFRVSTL